MPSRCGFCGALGVTKEHVWPDWLRKVILESRTSSGKKRFRAEIESGGAAKQFKSESLEMTVKMPCRSCNNGWMSALESQGKEFITGMADRGQTTLLTRDRQIVLSRWAVKTAMVYEFTSPECETKYFTEVERLAFKERLEIPENVWVWTGRYDGARPMHSLQRRARGRKPEKDVIRIPTIYSHTFSANFVALQVFAYRRTEGNLSQAASATRKERLMQIWPLDSTNMISWPPNITIDDDAMEILDDRFVSLLSKR